MGLDIKYEKKDPLYRFQTFRDELGISEYVKLYDGVEKLPFEDNMFSMIVCRSSLGKYTLKAKTSMSRNDLVKNRISEFIRILNDDKKIIVSPYGYENNTIKELLKKGAKLFKWNQELIIKKFHRENSTNKRR